jgi:hypothetical protein
MTLVRAPMTDRFSLLLIPSLHSTWQIYPHKASRALREDPVCIHYLSFPPRTRTSACVGACSACGCGALDVIVEALDDVAGAGFFQVGGFAVVDSVFDVCLYVGGLAGFDIEWGRDGEGGTNLVSNSCFFCSVSRRSRLSFS